MKVVTEFDTIAAISTPPGEGAISIVRLSGDQAIAVVKKIFSGRDLTKVASHTINYGHIINPETKQEIDEVMVSVMRAPKTFTREDIIEINCHGGIVPTNQILQLVLSSGARLAEPGEFTKRAFLHGRIDLSQAEAVMDLIRAKTDRSMKVALNQLDGNLGHLIKNLRQDILDVLAQVEVNIDYPEYDDVETLTTKMLQEKAVEVKQRIKQLLTTARQGKILREGLATAIIGRPNVGKSSLLNHLLHEDKAIVTDVAGTTRDVIEEYVNVHGVPLKLIDTAGIHQTEDKVEKIGVERSKQAINQADLVMILLNNSEPLTTEDRQLLELTADKKRLILLNKSDLPNKLEISQVQQMVDPKTQILQASVLKNQGLDQLEQVIADLFFGGIENSQTTVMVTNARHIALLKKAEQALDDVLRGIKQGMPVDLVQIDMTNCWELLGEITGDSYQDELLDQLFSQFCLGK
ncbi:MAG: tRNA uridine-5-carboxymethylaminomethyl(34) synthesis GTPase MnmE [Liquorilactobacillus nagelii]|mgnify:CR=1 FL=1|jgi:tRNA modification GTPase|uniref:tRNA modification GTPase MnmE n=1 Tax=Liquorilactobacillus nagelii TaxID=82688 RepID=A0A3Q8CTZ9_9LACO|nr:tRNA uridine-5-carboxymethylaminomethyl(34) synthesis GTPase MnmE [Liquorilactobacillus nagelii]AUJ31131.1 tRNA uridine-5-carboxymethylaminomethyl(34) synthesis GTPase MnmE [Liquorilactobacillus nagelii]MCI1633658.1 tRNA uridine-5-carboxymethylaminomethyl(34) synthesis GTPase MnmE [Liquorilactobacillus nagelii]MCI1699046.1 tRNA uridine-5-carboxymethylaminomethyl(34) synthesis GTPase MnmE [Liquorilactobacillus nagelii]MCI1921540.1 tRNA uridine-5-carboxymethylaminomethyl(34) synthesis GTPase M